MDPNDFIFQDTKLGSYKIRMNDEVGMTVAAGGQFLESEFAVALDAHQMGLQSGGTASCFTCSAT